MVTPEPLECKNCGATLTPQRSDQCAYCGTAYDLSAYRPIWTWELPPIDNIPCIGSAGLLSQWFATGR